MKVAGIDVFAVRLPFRLAFGHSLASRSSSDNLIARVRLDDGTVGFGEGVPRQYVTGETIEGATSAVLSHYAPRFLNLDVSDLRQVIASLSGHFEELGLTDRPGGASWCALELAMLDA